MAAKPHPLQDLERVLSLPALKWAWLRVRENRGAAGADGISLNRFERLLEANLLELADEVRNGTYQPLPVRTVVIHGPRKSRRIAILSVRDRILQRAVLELIDDYCERQFLKCSYGYRAGRSLHDAVNKIVQLRDSGMTTIVDADIERCFESLDHTVLCNVIHEMLPKLHPTLTHLISIWMCMRPHRGADAMQDESRGVLQGAPISPLLCNIYLHQMDLEITQMGYALVRYADDFVILCHDEDHANRCYHDMAQVLTGLHLNLNSAKTSITTFREGLDFLGVHFTEDEYSYAIDGKRVVIRDTAPPWFYYHPEGYDGD